MSELPNPIVPQRRTIRCRCLVCQSPMEVQRIAAARVGFEHWTLRCTSCGRVDQMQVNTDPLESEALGWIEGELRPPH
jgi:transposase-like protein